MGTIQAAALTVLTEAGGPLAPRQVRARAQALLGLTVSQDTISSFVSVASRDELSSVVRVQRGLYGVRR